MSFALRCALLLMPGGVGGTVQAARFAGGLIVGVQVVLGVLLPVLRRGVVLLICA